MTTRKRETDQQIDLATAQIRDSEIPSAEADAITARVWQRLENASAETADAAEVEAIRGCDDYQKLLPAFLAGSLSPSRTLLLEDHVRQCVPCRRALKQAREGGAEPTAREVLGVERPRAAGSRWLAAAAVAVLAVGAGIFMWSTRSSLPYGAVVESTGGGLFRAVTLEPIALGAELEVGERVLSAPGESSYLRLADGSRVEVRGRSELAIEARKGTTVRVERGDVIVEAAPQGAGRLYVSTDDCLVSVKGTIFAVSHGLKGSRVAVIEGEVQVDHAGREELLYAGDRTATYAGYAGGPIDDTFAWSRNVDSYLALLKEVSELRQALARDLPRPGLRYSSRLLDLVPEDMAFYAAFPNLAERVSEAHRIIEQRVADSPLLAQWWNSRGNDAAQAHLGAVSAMLGEVGGYLGDELVVTGALGIGGEMAGPLVLAELIDPEALRAFLGETARQHGAEGEIVFLDDAAATGTGEVVVWLGPATLIAGPDAEIVRAAVARLESDSRPAPTGLKRRLAETYAEGAEILVAADLQRLAQATGELGDDRAALEELGLLDARHLILQQRHVGERTENDAVLAFDGPRRGIAAWLAEPAPMGSLDYVSPDAKLAAAAVLERPVVIFDQLMAFAAGRGETSAAELERIERDLGISLRDDVAGALGGEVAFALDGPILPEPAWKMIVEVYDPDKLVWALQRVLAAANDQLAEEGKERLEWTEETVNGRTYYGFGGDGRFEVTFDEGYMIAGSGRGVLERAIRFRQSGYTLTTSSRFAQLLPEGGNVNFSALFYQDALELLAPLADRIAGGGLTEGQAAAIEELRQQSEPTLAYAYGEADRIVFAAGGVADLLSAGLPALLGFGDLDFGPGPPAGDPSDVTADVATERNSLRPAA